MLKAYALRIHRWAALIFALPLLVLIVTGLVLAFEPAITTLAINPESLSAERLDALIVKADPDGKARSLSLRPHENMLVVGGGRGVPPVGIDLASGEPTNAATTLGTLMNTARGLHEHLIYNLDWLVSLSTAVMLALAILGIVMGWPMMIRNTMSGWHKMAGWGLLPMAIIIPVTGLVLAFGKGNMQPPKAEAPKTLREAVQLVSKEQDPSRLLSIRQRGPVLMAQINDDGRNRAYAVTTQGLEPMPSNWSRLIHEGNWAGTSSALLNIVTSLAFLISFVTGLVIWYRRQTRQRHRHTA